MELRQLEYFMAIWETGGFSSAAERLYVSQSSLSKQIMKLEHELGQALFIRGGRTVVPTEAGDALARTAPEILLAWQKLCGELSHGVLTLAVTQILAHYGLTERLAEFSKSHPELRLQILERENAEIPKLLESRQAELAIFRWDSDISSGLERLPLLTDELALVVPRAHPLSGLGTVSLRQLEREKFILLGSGTRLQAAIGGCFQRAGLSPEVVYEGSNTDAIRSLVASGAGVSIMLSGIAFHLAQEDARLTALRFTETSNLEIVLAFTRGGALTPGARALRSFLRKSSRSPAV